MSKKPATLEMADDLEHTWGMPIHAAEMRRLHAVEAAFKEWPQDDLLDKRRAEVLNAYNEGRRDGLYAARNAINERFGL